MRDFAFVEQKSIEVYTAQNIWEVLGTTLVSWLLKIISVRMPVPPLLI